MQIIVLFTEFFSYRQTEPLQFFYGNEFNYLEKIKSMSQIFYFFVRTNGTNILIIKNKKILKKSGCLINY